MRRRERKQIQNLLGKQEIALIDKRSYTERCKMELASWRELKSYNDVVKLGEAVMNAILAPPDIQQVQVTDKKTGETELKEVLTPVLDLKQASVLGFLMSIQLNAIRNSKTEFNPDARLDDKLQGDDVEMNMSDEDLRKLVTASNVNVQIKILNKSVRVPEAREREPIDLEGKMLPQSLKTAITTARSLDNVCEAEIIQEKSYDDEDN